MNRHWKVRLGQEKRNRNSDVRTERSKEGALTRESELIRVLSDEKRKELVLSDGRPME